MSEQTTEAPEIVERDDSNNANLLTFEVTWENGTVEQVKAHWVWHPSRSAFDEPGDHIKFAGWYDGVHRIALSARPDRIRCIRDLGILPPLPDVDADPFAGLFAACTSESGQVTAAAPVRIDSLVPRVVDGELITVLHPHWYDGNPVTIVSLRLSAGDYVSVVFQLPGTSDRAAVDVPADFLVTPVGGA